MNKTYWKNIIAIAGLNVATKVLGRCSGLPEEGVQVIDLTTDVATTVAIAGLSTKEIFDQATGRREL